MSPLVPEGLRKAVLRVSGAIRSALCRSKRMLLQDWGLAISRRGVVV